MTNEQRKAWARAVIKHEPPAYMYQGLSYVEAALRTKALFAAAAQLGSWTFLPQHLVLLHNEMLKRSKQ